jgi:hypothetical protein
MFNRINPISLTAILFVSLNLAHSALAYSFNDYESAGFLAKIPEVKIETNLIATHVGNNDAIKYYVHVLGQYWTAEDTKALSERNAQLANLISSAINDTITFAEVGNADKAYRDYFDIAGYMEQAGEVRVDFPMSANSTVQAMAIVKILNESLARYGDAINSPIDPADMSSVNMSKVSIKEITPSGPQKIVNKYAYENSKALANEALQMFGQLITHNSYKQPYNDKISNSLTKYISDLNAMADRNTVMADIQVNTYPNFVAGYEISPEPIPEFPFPTIFAIATISLVIAIARFGLEKSFISF